MNSFRLKITAVIVLTLVLIGGAVLITMSDRISKAIRKSGGGSVFTKFEWRYVAYITTQEIALSLYYE